MKLLEFFNIIEDIRNDIKLDYNQDVEQENRGFVVDQIDAYLGNREVGYLKMSYVPKELFHKFFPSILHFQSIMHGKHYIPYDMRHDLRHWSQYDEDVQRQILGSILVSTAWSKQGMEKTLPLGQVQGLIRKYERRYADAKGPGSFKDFYAHFVNKPFVDYIRVDSGDPFDAKAFGREPNTEGPDMRRQGIGTMLYRAGGQWMKERGMQLHASGTQSDEAKAAWQKMVSGGEAGQTKYGRYFHKGVSESISDFQEHGIMANPDRAYMEKLAQEVQRTAHRDAHIKGFYDPRGRFWVWNGRDDTVHHMMVEPELFAEYDQPEFSDWFEVIGDEAMAEGYTEEQLQDFYDHEGGYIPFIIQVEDGRPGQVWTAFQSTLKEPEVRRALGESVGVRLKEMPVRNIQTFGMDEPQGRGVPAWQQDLGDEQMARMGKPSMPQADIKMLQNEKYWNVVKKKFSKTKYTYDLYFANLNLPALTIPRDEKEQYAGAPKERFSSVFQDLLSSTSGVLPEEMVREEWGIPISETEGVIAVLYLSNADASRVSMRMTPWIMAHRLGHAVDDELQKNDDSGDYRELVQNYFSTNLRSAQADLYNPDRDNDEELEQNPNVELVDTDEEMYLNYIIPYENLLTMKTARTGTLQPGEAMPEMLAQFILTGQVTLARPVPPEDEDQLVSFTNGYTMDDHYITWNAFKEAEFIENAVEEVEMQVNSFFNQMFDFYQEAGVIFVAP